MPNIIAEAFKQEAKLDRRRESEEDVTKKAGLERCYFPGFEDGGGETQAKISRLLKEANSLLDPPERTQPSRCLDLSPVIPVSEL